ncbi:DUF1415 domain-containing protein [Agaribacterium sp. ZY112]|uniref:DUF1415 domain-containing protein n=1 Tax=Agaribacterium sp. ZY112 TaxID=3233574 RepID=UPI003523F543
MNKLKQAQNKVEQWLEEVVIGLGLCPFAAYPHQQDQVHIEIYEGNADEKLLNALTNECQRLYTQDRNAANYVETSLICLSHALSDFIEYNDFLGLANLYLEQEGWSGHFQLASFHPGYQFAHTAPDDKDNLTNRAPLPIFHIIREASLEHVLSTYEDPEGIYERNIQCVHALTEAQLISLFPHIYKPK